MKPIYQITRIGFGNDNGSEFEPVDKQDTDGRSIVNIAIRHGHANDTVTLYRDGVAIARAKWSISERRYYKVTI